MQHFATWRIEVGQKARQVRLLPRATTKERARLDLKDIEVYAAQRVDELAAKVSVADLNGDGSERPGGDVYKAELELINRSGMAALDAFVAWGPDGVTNKEILLGAEGPMRLMADGTIKQASMGTGLAAGRLANLYPGEPEVLATLGSQDVTLWSARRDKDGKHIQLGSRPMTGFNASTSASGVYRGFSCIQPVEGGGFKGLLAAIGNGLNGYPITDFLSTNATTNAWSFNTGGAPVVGALSADLNGDGTPEVLLARRDGFVNVFRLNDGKELGLLNTGEPILGMALLRDSKGKSLLAVGTKFAVHLFDSSLRPAGRQALPAVAFAGPGGKNRDRAYVVDAAGKVTVLILK